MDKCKALQRQPKIEASRFPKWRMDAFPPYGGIETLHGPDKEIP